MIVARDKYKMNVLASAIDEFASIQNGLGVLEKNLKEQRDVIKKILRARAKGNRYFHQNERGTSEVLAKISQCGFADRAGNLSNIPRRVYDQRHGDGR